jgi:hypothetical protein
MPLQITSAWLQGLPNRRIESQQEFNLKPQDISIGMITWLTEAFHPADHQIRS